MQVIYINKKNRQTSWGRYESGGRVIFADSPPRGSAAAARALDGDHRRAVGGLILVGAQHAGLVDAHDGLVGARCAGRQVACGDRQRHAVVGVCPGGGRRHVVVGEVFHFHLPWKFGGAGGLCEPSTRQIYHRHKIKASA